MALPTNDIRQAFLEFFAKNGHEVMASSPLVPQNDPTLMFTNAGMVQFKDIFTGREKPKAPRAATSQKCVRAGGKHNDLENVGYTARHHTFFEMLGNFSFGDYFKERAIELAWKLLVEEYQLPKDKLTVTVYHTDDEAFALWKKISGFADSRIIRIPTNDNFWAMGDTGPCGPCSEIFYDHGEKIFGGPPGSKDADGDRFVEIWNLVFMQYEQVDAKTRNSLPKPSIDTGMGLERIAAVLQGVTDNYDIDLFKTLIKASEELTQTRAAGENKASHRVIADHLRASSFLIADGVLPSNEGRGYVLRRIMRRAMRHIHMLGAKDAVMHRLVPTLVSEMGTAYPELKRAEKVIAENLRAEEERFKQTLDRGLKLLEEESASLKKGGQLRGDIAFKLYDTYGFPLDLTQDILRARGVTVDTDGFDTAMEKQKDMARAAWSGSGERAVEGTWLALRGTLPATRFLGYDETRSAVKILAIIDIGSGKEKDALNPGEEAYVVLDQTPFYGESGGQVGDTGWLLKGSEKIAEVRNTTKPVETLFVHEVEASATLRKGDTLTASIDSARRDRIRANHSATHILHAVLRKQLGEHITQKGSLVHPDKLRFDISHNKSIAREELSRIEQEVNRVIAQNSDTRTEIMAPAEAQKKGAMALFGEKYGDSVRVLSMGADEGGMPYSMELCGGTHVRRTGDIGAFKITGEGSVASGIRRVEAVTGEGVREYALRELNKLEEQARALTQEKARLLAELKKPAAPEFTAAAVELLRQTPLHDVVALYEKESARLQQVLQQLQEDNKKLAKELAEAKKQAALGNAEATVEKVGGTNFIGRVFDGLDPKELRSLAESYRQQADIIVLGTAVEGKASVLVAVNAALTGQYNAAALVQAAVAQLGGKGGGGRPEMAQGGGPDASKIEDAIAIIRESLRKSA